MSSLQTWIVVLSNLVLVGVTTWYALLTRKMGKAAQASAESSRIAAEAAATSVAATIASVDVDFTVAPWYFVDGDPDDLGPGWVGVQIWCSGATVYLHGATLTEIGEAVAETPDSPQFIDEVDIRLDLYSNVTLPARLHRRESLLFSPPDNEARQIEAGVLEVLVDYSLDGRVVNRRRVNWFGRPGNDYGAPGS